MSNPDSFDGPNSFDLIDQSAQDAQIPAEAYATAPRRRAVGSPLSTGQRRHASYSSADARVNRLPAPPPDSALGGASVNGAAAGETSSLQRAASMLRSALPFVQRLLPLLDGNIATTVSGFLAP